MRLVNQGRQDIGLIAQPIDIDQTAGFNIQLNELTDVDTTGVANNSIIKYNSSSGNWEIGTDTDTGIENVVEDTTPQLGGDLDLNSNNITGTGAISISNTGDVITANNTTNSNGAVSLLLKKTASNLTRGVNLNTEIDNGSGTVYKLHQIRSRRFGDEDDKQLQFFDIADAGGSATKLVQFKKNLNWSSTYPLVEMQMNGRIDLTVLNADDMPNSNITTAVMDGTTTTQHNMLTGVCDFGTSSITDGASLTLTGEADNDAASDRLRIGQIILAYGASEEDNKIQFRIQSHDKTSVLSRFEIDGEQAEVDVPFKMPNYSVANLPTSGITSGAMALVLDESTVTGGKCMVFYDGTNWKLVHSPTTTAS